MSISSRPGPAVAKPGGNLLIYTSLSDHFCGLHAASPGALGKLVVSAGPTEESKGMLQIPVVKSMRCGEIYGSKR